MVEFIDPWYLMVNHQRFWWWATWWLLDLPVMELLGNDPPAWLKAEVVMEYPVNPSSCMYVAYIPMYMHVLYDYVTYMIYYDMRIYQGMSCTALIRGPWCVLMWCPSPHSHDELTPEIPEILEKEKRHRTAEEQEKLDGLRLWRPQVSSVEGLGQKGRPFLPLPTCSL